jgi:hypothetical protein
MTYIKLKLLTEIERNINYILGNEVDENNEYYKDVYVNELNRIANEMQENFSSGLYTQSELVTIFRKQFIDCFGADNINHHNAIFEKILMNYRNF